MVTAANPKRTTTKGLFSIALIILLAVVVWVIAQINSEKFQALSDCIPSDKVSVICGLKNPEDIARVESTDYLIASQYSGLEPMNDGSLIWINHKTGQHGQLFPSTTKAPFIEKSKTNDQPSNPLAWGDPNCKPLPNQKINPHGIDLFVDDTNTTRLYVVNHAVRESIEMFELLQASNTEKPELKYRGCVAMPEEFHLNDVSGFSDGGFVTTDMGATPGLDAGAAYLWTAIAGLKQIPDTEGMIPNGITLSPDEKIVFINYYSDNKVKSFDLSSEQLLAETEIQMPDNSTWFQSSNGELNLLITSQKGGWIESVFCSRLKEGTCPMAYQILSVNPNTLDAVPVYSHDGGAPMGAGTVGLKVEDKLYMGSYASEWLAFTDFPTKKQK